jgi:peptide/nickel transport system substrate-binding protein
MFNFVSPIRGPRLGFVSLACVIALAVLGSTVPLAVSAAPKGEIVVAGPVLRQQFDPTAIVSVADWLVTDLLFDGLLNLGPQGKYPALAESWTVSQDGKLIDFKLRTGVKFHNGDPFTADDVKFTYDKLLAPDSTHVYRRAFQDALERVDVVAPDHVRFILKQPWPAFFTAGRYGLQPIMPKSYYEKVGRDGFQSKPIGTGPYKLVDLKSGEWSKFEANTQYWGAPSNVQFVTQRLVKEPFTLYAMIEKGEADIVVGLTGPLLERVRKNASFKVFSARYSGTSMMFFNKTKFPESADRKVRLAIGYALNRDGIAKQILNGVCEVSASVFTPATFGFVPGLSGLPYDPAKAKSLLAEAGIKPGKEVTFTVQTDSFGSLPNAPQVLEVLAGNLEAVGLKVTRESYDVASWLAMQRAGKQPAVFYVPYSLPDDGGEMLSWYISKSIWTTGNVAVPEYDRISDEQAKITDAKAREKLLQDFARMEDERRETIPLFWCDSPFAAGPRIKSWAPAIGSPYTLHLQSVELAN